MAHITKEELRLAVQAGYARGMVDGLDVGMDIIRVYPEATVASVTMQGTQDILREDKADAIQKLIAYRDARSKK